MSVLLSGAVGVTIAAGVYLILARDLLRSVLGVSLVGVAANLALFAAGRPNSADGAPVLAVGQEALDASAANPLPQALVLTAIVIGFALTCVSLVIVLAVAQRAGVSESEGLRKAEPPAGADGKPIIEDGEAS